MKRYVFFIDRQKMAAIEAESQEAALAAFLASRNATTLWEARPNPQSNAALEHYVIEEDLA